MAKFPSHPHFLWKNLFRQQKTEKTTVLEALGQNILFSTLTKSELSYLAKLVYERLYLPEEPIFTQNDRGLGMYLIVEGRVSIRTLTESGEQQLTILREGNFFGELALVDPDNVRTASAISLDKCIVVGFFKPDLMEILDSRPQIGVKILYQLSVVLGRRLSSTTQKITELKRENIMLLSRKKPTEELLPEPIFANDPGQELIPERSSTTDPGMTQADITKAHDPSRLQSVVRNAKIIPLGEHQNNPKSSGSNADSDDTGGPGGDEAREKEAYFIKKRGGGRR